MREARRAVVALVVLGAVLAAHALASRAPVGTSTGSLRLERDGAHFMIGSGRSAGLTPLPESVRRATLRFDPAVAPADRAAVLAAIAGARPEARRLIGLVDGLVLMHVGPVGQGVLGVTEVDPDHYDVTVDLAAVAPASGARGVARLVLHELGHVVDDALLPDELIAALDDGIPHGWGCDDGVSGACAPREERFAESFAKWATGDIGLDLYLGYRVPPPGPTLDSWGAPLARFGA
jgi:hypothetical protein